jgi:hypothetical protein
MALATQHWRMLQPVVVPATGSATTGGIAGVLNAIYTLGTATSYADGSARSPGTFTSPGTASLPASVGTGSAWTWNYDDTTFNAAPPAPQPKTGLYAYPPTTTAINQVVMLGGASSITGAAWKQLYDIRAANALYAGIAKNSGLYTSWNNGTTPFTSGDFTGLANGGALSTGTAYVVYMVECEESVMVAVATAGGATMFYVVAGAFVDPLSSNTNNAETDGRLYGVAVNGSGSTQPATWLAGTAISGALFTSSATGTNAHSVTFTPGAGTVAATVRFGDYAPGASFTSRNGDFPQIPFQITTGTNYGGQLRQISITRDSTSMVAWESGGTVKGYLLSSATSSANDAILLVY